MLTIRLIPLIPMNSLNEYSDRQGFNYIENVISLSRRDYVSHSRKNRSI